jgi:hypothetical protein
MQGSLCYLGSILINQEEWNKGMRLLRQAVDLTQTMRIPG